MRSSVALSKLIAVLYYSGQPSMPKLGEIAPLPIRDPLDRDDRNLRGRGPGKGGHDLLPIGMRMSIVDDAQVFRGVPPALPPIGTPGVFSVAPREEMDSSQYTFPVENATIRQFRKRSATKPGRNIHRPGEILGAARTRFSSGHEDYILNIGQTGQHTRPQQATRDCLNLPLLEFVANLTLAKPGHCDHTLVDAGLVDGSANQAWPHFPSAPKIKNVFLEL